MLERALITLVVMVVLVAATLVRSKFEVEHTMLRETTYTTAELSGELRVVQITDLHNLPRRSQVAAIADLARSAKPDVIALTGDLLNTHNASLAPVEWLLDDLEQIGVPMYFVDGNHDHWSSDQEELHRLLVRHGVRVLSDEHLTITGRWGSATLIGVDDYFSGHGDLGRAVAGAPDRGFRLVLTHSPEISSELVTHDIDYAMCGHTHGGQIRLPFVGALYQPGGNYLPELSKGTYGFGSSTLFIDSGVGVTGPNHRLFNQSQITLHRLGSAG